MKNKRFTLIELLIVTLIIAVIVSLLLPVLKSARDRGAAIACTGNMRQFFMLCHTYIDDYDYIMPGWFYLQGENRGYPDIMSRLGYIPADVKEKKMIYLCSFDQRKALDPNVNKYYSYRINSTLGMAGSSTLFLPRYKIMKAKTPSKTSYISQNLCAGPSHYYRYFWNIPWLNYPPEHYDGNGCNLIFLDGHQEYAGKSRWEYESSLGVNNEYFFIN